VQAPNSKTNGRGKTKIGVNVPRGMINGCINFQFKVSKVIVRARNCVAQGGRPHNMPALD